MRCLWRSLALLFVSTACSAGQPAPLPVLGAVASTDHQATDAGAEILQAGGNAVDAAVATALALAVVNPQAGNLGGGGFAVIRFGQAVTSLDFRETAPSAAHASMYLDSDGTSIPNASTRGPLAAGVPGSPHGYFSLHRHFGRLPWRDVVAPAIALAAQGLVVSERLLASIAWKQDVLALFPSSGRWLPDGKPPEIGSRISLDDLADTLRRYADAGPDGLAPVFARVAEVAVADGGILTVTDMTAYRARWRAPVQVNALGWQIAAMDLPSSGGIILGQTLGILERLDWHRQTPVLRDHLLIEAWRRAYADRYLLADPARTRATATELLDDAWLDRRAQEISSTYATPSTTLEHWSEGLVKKRVESPETTHLSVLDAEGNAVAMTVTLNGTFGSGFFVPGAGFFLNNEMDDFTTAPGEANMFGLVQGDANTVAPGARMLSSMTPTLAWRQNDLIALGSPGGSRIPTATIQVLLQRLVAGWSLARAVALPRFHHQWLPDRVMIEEGVFAARHQDALVSMGHMTAATSWHIGEVNAVERMGGHVQAVADGRVDGATGRVVRAEKLLSLH